MEYKTSTGKCEICGKGYKYPLYYSELREKICFSCELMLLSVEATMQVAMSYSDMYTGDIEELVELIKKYKVLDARKDDNS